MMYKNNKNIIKFTGVVFVLCILGGYAYIQSRNLLEGPQIQIETPLNGSSTHSSLTEIAGNVKNVSKISLNDRPIFIDENGNFSEKILLSQGYNVVKIEAQDKFGHDAQKLLELVYN